MLRIWQMSGQQLLAASMEEISDVKELKASLRSLHGFPMCMQQLLHNGINLDNSTKLDAPVDLQLALSAKVQQAEAAKELADACKQGDLTVARLLLEAGADENAQDGEGYTALMVAVQNGHMEIARLLSNAGADKDLQGPLATQPSWWQVRKATLRSHGCFWTLVLTKQPS